MAKSRKSKKNKRRKQIKINHSTANVAVSTTETLAVGTYLPRLRPRVRLGSNIEVIPQSCIIPQREHLAVHGTTAHKLQPSPIMLERVGEIILPRKQHKKKWGNKNKAFVPRSCIAEVVSTVGDCNDQLVNLKDNLTPAYDWRKIFPEPIKLNRVPNIIGPRLRFRTKKYTSPATIFVPPGCIITPEESNTQQVNNASETVVITVEDQAALAQAAPSAENNQFNIITASAVVLFAIFLLFLLTQ